MALAVVTDSGRVGNLQGHHAGLSNSDRPNLYRVDDSATCRRDMRAMVVSSSRMHVLVMEEAMSACRAVDRRPVMSADRYWKNADGAVQIGGESGGYSQSGSTYQ